MEIIGKYFCLSLVKDGDKYGLIDDEGNIVLPIEYDKFYSRDSYNEIKRENKWGIIDYSGKICLPAIWDHVISLLIHPYCYMRVTLGRKVGLYNAETGKEIIPVIMDEIDHLYCPDGVNYSMKNRFVVVSKGGKEGVFDLEGREIIPIKYKVIRAAEHACGCFEIRTFVGDYDCKYEYFTQEGVPAFPLSDGLEYEKSPRELACVKKNGKYGFINIKGDVVVPVVYDAAGYYDDGTGWIKQGSSQIRVDRNGKTITRIKSLSSGEEIQLSKDYGEPDAVTPWSALYLEKRILVTNEFIGGMYRRDCYRLAIIDLDDIVCVVNEEGSIGSKYTRTFHTDSCSIETDSDDLSIGSTQHDYYDYMDPQSSFYIITKNRRYKIDSDYPSETETIWGWIVDYFKKKNED
jgi:hypothetical protein